MYIFAQHKMWYHTGKAIYLSIVSELQDKLKHNADFKKEGNMIPFSFNEESPHILDTLANNITFGKYW